MNVAVRFHHRMDECASETAIVGTGDTELTYDDLDRQTKQVSAWLADRGLGEGDQVAVYLPDTAAYLPVMLGIWRVGAVASPINTRFGLEELTYTLSDLGPAALIGSDTFEDNVAALQNRVDGLSEETTLFVEQDGNFDRNALPAAESAPKTERQLDDDPAVVMYTSGTTGRPKGVVQTHRNVGAQLDVNVTHFDMTRTDVSLVAVPLFHVGGLYGGALPALLEGATVVVQPAWDAGEWAKLVETHEATLTGLIPTMMLDALNTDEARAHDTSSLKQVFYGGSPATEKTLDSFQSVFGVDTLRNYYGQTENTGLSVTYGPDTERQPGLMGRPVHAVDYRVVDVTADDLVDVDPNEEGELLLQGDIITPGYWDSSLDADYFTDGWLHTDDVVREDEGGLLYYVDRVDDMIISGGENVAPSEVENALQQHPDIDAVAVFGIEHERLGETVTAAIVAPEGEVTTESIADWWDNTGLAGYKRPRRIETVEEFPRTATQKIDKVTLREQLAE
ncbi:class I adenylate-forming enzyme family protein [Halovenus sp. HT40]|uniref:class I adenylate-forming enzyme family protein n=1 Tax=Halovenus sp. HT40 TaxID=3126691 RepID=UPI00300F1D08